MIQFLKDKVTDHFEKLLLAGLFIGIVILAIHLMNKNDAGGDDAGFIVWAETQAAFVLGALLQMITGQKKPTPPAIEPPATEQPKP